MRELSLLACGANLAETLIRTSAVGINHFVACGPAAGPFGLQAKCMNDRVQRLRRDLTEAVAPPTCPTGYRVRTFAADDAPTVHRLLEVGYAQGGGHIGAFEEWWPSLRDDHEFAPDLCFLAVDERQDIVGVAQCWTSAFIKDLVVHPLARRRGIAAALLRRVFWEFRRRGEKHVDLKVQVENPTGAVRLYKELGMREVALDGS